MTPQQADAFLGAAAMWLDHPDAPVQVGAIKAVSALADDLEAHLLRPHLPRLYQGESAWHQCLTFACSASAQFACGAVCAACCGWSMSYRKYAALQSIGKEST
jgi:hypothetical protein